MNNKFCENCGKIITEDMNFCRSCGYEINSSMQDDEEMTTSSSDVIEVEPPILETPISEIPIPEIPIPEIPNPMIPIKEIPIDLISKLDHRLKPLGTGQYILAFILLSIPIVGFILLLVWAFASKINKNRQNLARAILILGIIGLFILAIFTIFFWSEIFNILETVWYL